MAWYSPKNGNAWTKCLPNHFGGCFTRFLDSVVKFGRSKWNFLAFENGHFWQKCPFSSAKKWHFERPNLRTDSKNLAKHPPKWWGRHLVHAFPFLGEYQANFWKLPILGPSGALFPLPRTPNFKWLAQWHLWVYKFETCFLGSPNHPETALRSWKTKANIFFWPRLMIIRSLDH